MVKSTKAIHMDILALEKCTRCSRDIKGSSISSVAWISVPFPRENRFALRSRILKKKKKKKSQTLVDKYSQRSFDNVLLSKLYAASLSGCPVKALASSLSVVLCSTLQCPAEGMPAPGEAAAL